LVDEESGDLSDDRRRSIGLGRPGRSPLGYFRRRDRTHCGTAPYPGGASFGCGSATGCARWASGGPHGTWL